MNYDFKSLHEEALEKIDKLQQERDELKSKLEDMTLCRDIASGHARQAEKERDLARKQLSNKEAIIKEAREALIKHFMELKELDSNYQGGDITKIIAILDKGSDR